MRNNHCQSLRTTRRQSASITTSCIKQQEPMETTVTLQYWPMETIRRSARQTIQLMLAMKCTSNHRPQLQWVKLSLQTVSNQWWAWMVGWKFKTWYEWASKMRTIWTASVPLRPTTYPNTRLTRKETITAILTRVVGERREEDMWRLIVLDHEWDKEPDRT